MASLLSYKKMPGFAKTDGQLFEVNLAALLFLRGLNSGLNFQLATNVDGAGAMDDVVFRYMPSTEEGTWTTLYVQLKHKETVKVSRKLLKNQKEGFYIPKYYKSYLEIKQAMSGAETLFDGSFEKSVFLIFTNAKANQTLGEGRCEPLSQAEKFVWCGVGQVFNFKDDQEILTCLSEYSDEGNMFLGRLQLFCGQPNAHGLEAAVEKELHKVDNQVIESVDFKSLLDCFLRHMKVWWETSSEVLHRGNDILRSAILEVTSQQTEKRCSLGLAFEEAVLETFRDSFKGDLKIFTIKSSESSCRLSLTKLCQTFGGQSLVLDCAGLLANRGALLSQCRKGQVKGLIICTNDWSSSQKEDYFNVVKDLLASANTPPIVFLFNDDSCAVEVFTCKFQEMVNCFDDKFLFSQVKEESREKVLAMNVSLQGHSTTLSKLLQGTPTCTDRVLHACALVEALDSVDSLTIGPALDKGIGYYVNRYLELTTVVKASILQDATIRENVTVRVKHCEILSVLRNNEVNARKFEILQVTCCNGEAGLFESVIRFLALFVDNVNEKNIVSNLCQSHLVADSKDCEVFSGSEFLLGVFKCNSVVLRLGTEDAVTALRVCTSSLGGFLFVSDKTSEDDVRKLSDFHQSKHLLSLDDGQLRWIQSHGDIESIRPHIDKDQMTTISPENATDVEDRLVLVCAEPGMGKSTLMARLAKNTKEAHPHFFVFLITLNDHSRLFAQDKHKNVLEFLCSTNKIESHLHRSLLKYALEVSGDVVVLFDGYDEISPKYIRQSCVLLSSLIKETKVSKIWMTSRNSMKLTLEAKTSKFSANLSEFDRADQENFLRKFLARKSQLPEKEFSEFINRLIEKASQAVRDKDTNFMGIPLQTQMLAEVYEDHVTGSAEKTELPDKLDLLVLLEQFVDKKFNIYFRDKLGVLPSDTNDAEFLKMSKKGFVKSHARAALILILGDDEIVKLRMKSTIKKSLKFFKEIQSGSYKTGFIDSIVNDKPRFIHRVFAEYFVAKWLSKKFEDYKELVESKMFTADFAVIRNLFDRLLAKDHVLHTAVVNEDLEEVQTLLEREDVHEKDGGGRMALHLAASRGTSEDQQENKRRGDILDLILGKTSEINHVDDVLNGSPLKYADISRSWVAVDRFKPCLSNKEQFTWTLKDITNSGMVGTVFALDLHNLLGFCLDNGLDDERCSEGKSRLLFRACELGSVKVASFLVKRNPDINEVSGQTNLFLHKASENGHLEIVKLLHEHQVCSLGCTSLDHKLTGSQELKPAAYINVANHVGKTANHLAAQNNHVDVISFLTTHGGDPRSCDSTNNTPMHLAAECKHPDALKVILEAVDETDRVDAINSCDSYGNSVLLKASLGGCLDCVRQTVEAGGKWTLKSSAGHTPLMTAATEGHHEVVRYFLNNYGAEREDTSRLDYINTVNDHGWNATQLAASRGHADIIEILINQGSDLNFRAHDNRSYLQYAARSGQPGAVRILLNALDEDDRAGAVNLGDERGYSALMSCAAGGCVDSVKLLIEAGGKLTQVSDVGHTPLMLAALRGRQEVISHLLSICSTKRVEISKKDYINMTDKYGKSAIHYAALRGYYHVIYGLMSQGEDQDNRERHYSRSLYEVAWFKDPGVVRMLLEAVDEADRTVLANSSDTFGNSVLMCAALGGCVETVDLLVKAGAKITYSSHARHTSLMFAALQGHVEVLRYIFKNFNAEREGCSFQDFINMADKDGKTAIHYAIKSGALQVVSFLIEKGSNPQSCDRLKITPLHLAASFGLTKIVSVLLATVNEADRAAAVNSRDDIDGDSVLMCGVRGGFVDCLKLLVQAGGKFAQTNYNQRSPLMEAVFTNNPLVLEYLLSVFDPVREGMSKQDYITLKDKAGNTALDLARSECFKILQKFLV